MLDRERVLSKIDKFDNYLEELAEILPANFEEYKKIEKKRSCERLLQLSIECIIDISNLFVSGLRLGLPAEENDLFNKMRKKGLISEEITTILKQMRGLRNILIHEYTIIDDKIVYDILKTKLEDLKRVRKEIIKALKENSK